ncbi:beta-ketoacyl synthase N-terminal-like domain-containing protein [Flavobacterium granuli]|uniref:3-oxoacyl-(Acyl-carrier-protein) synthase n=1 Tax=Flavobacterium granuli TaxID=280093 RepID=A0ABU1RX94_9FLAO|nr:beta-ketoacyl synthase N-terminal-like domain-containing protein [Flavobacterium granuli]MDR6843391.1 3-oxoacyl-(acyl-carrier-protein) synthase [Flavobacterium granuli]
MKKTYINGLGCISAQKTFDTVFLEEAELNVNDTVLPLKTPVYKDFISPVAIRRMAKGVKNGIVASALALREAKLETVEAIITGTGMGCIEDSEKFLKSILDNDEQFLTPTSFIQSTHNTVGGQIALGMHCKGYNLTYVNGSVSFESALYDAKMMIEEEEASSILVGGIDETADSATSLFQLAGIIKEENQSPYSVLESTTKGVVLGEGATFFVLENEIKVHTIAEILDVAIFNRLDLEEVESKIISFLASNDLEINDIDAVLLGHNGDVDSDLYYKKLTDITFSNIPQVYYKHLSGEYDTASAFGLWVGSKIIQTQNIPDIAKINTLDKQVYKTVLLYNQRNGIDHSFTLISKS